MIQGNDSTTEFTLVFRMLIAVGMRNLVSLIALDQLEPYGTVGLLSYQKNNPWWHPHWKHADGSSKANSFGTWMVQKGLNFAYIVVMLSIKFHSGLHAPTPSSKILGERINPNNHPLVVSPTKYLSPLAVPIPVQIRQWNGLLLYLIVSGMVETSLTDLSLRSSTYHWRLMSKSSSCPSPGWWPQRNRAITYCAMPLQL